MTLNINSPVASGCGTTYTKTCNANDTCIVPLDPCSFVNGYYYITLSNANTFFIAYYDRKYFSWNFLKIFGSLKSS